jgi:RNA polymerase sigma-70 factor, ECF subfamily
MTHFTEQPNSLATTRQAWEKANKVSREPKYPSDAELIGRIAARDQIAEEILVKKYWSGLMREAMKKGLPLLDAEEVVNDTFLAAIEQAQKHRLGSKVGPWLRRVARNRSVDRYRLEKNFAEHQAQALSALGDLTSDEAQAIDDSNDCNFTTFATRRALSNLKSRDRRILKHHAERVENQDLAKYESVSENTARQIRHRAIRRFKREYRRITRDS